MRFSESVRKCFRDYAVFEGRSSRSEYWWFALFLVPFAIVAMLIDYKLFAESAFQPASAIYDLTMIVPTYAVTARRLHDVNLSGWWQAPYGVMLILGYIAPDFLSSLPISGLMVFLVVFLVFSIFLLIKAVTIGTSGQNQYGADPLEAG